MYGAISFMPDSVWFAGACVGLFVLGLSWPGLSWLCWIPCGTFSNYDKCAPVLLKPDRPENHKAIFNRISQNVAFLCFKFFSNGEYYKIQREFVSYMGECRDRGQ